MVQYLPARTPVSSVVEQLEQGLTLRVEEASLLDCHRPERALVMAAVVRRVQQHFGLAGRTRRFETPAIVEPAVIFPALHGEPLPQLHRRLCVALALPADRWSRARVFLAPLFSYGANTKLLFDPHKPRKRWHAA